MGSAVVIKISIEMGESTVSKNLIDSITGFNTELINKEDGTTSYLGNAQEQHKNKVIKSRTGFKNFFLCEQLPVGNTFLPLPQQQRYWLQSKFFKGR